MKFVCQVCGYVHEGDTAPEKCPQCGAPAEKFTAQSGAMEWAAEHVVGVAQGASEDIMADLRANFNGECTEVGMYLAMARVAHREGYPEIGLYWEKAAWEEAEHAAKFAELLGEVEEKTMQKYFCNPCGYTYDPEKGDPEHGIAPGTAFEDLPDDWCCPLCGVSKSMFQPCIDNYN